MFLYSFLSAPAALGCAGEVNVSLSRVDKLYEAGDMDLGGVNVTTANDATVRCIEDECAIDGVEITEWKELWVSAREVSCCRDV